MIVRQKIEETSQNENETTYAGKLSANDRDLDWQQSSKQLSLQVRALNPTPVATAVIAEQKCKIWEATPEETLAVRAAPGDILYAGADGISIQTKDGSLKLTKIQPPGKKPMSASDFLNGYSDRINVVGK